MSLYEYMDKYVQQGGDANMSMIVEDLEVISGWSKSVRDGIQFLMDQGDELDERIETLESGISDLYSK